MVIRDRDLPHGAATLALTVIVPVHGGEAYIAANLREITRTLETLGVSFEVLVVCDGRVDDTAVAAEGLDDERVRVLSYEDNRGKGYAICFGVTRARGRFVGWLDSDLDIAAEAIVAAFHRLQPGSLDAVIGSKRHPASVVDYPLRRRFFSWGFQMLVRALFRVNVRDTQVGAKMFRREMLETVVPLLLIKQYAFDLEVLAVGVEFGFDRIEEMPVRIGYRFTGTGINREAVQRMFLDTLAIAYRIHIRHWYVRRYAALQRQRADAQTALDRAPLVPEATTWSEILANHP
jgi:glycosyltransferase involved in cell wall biosynthesis